MLSLNVGSFSCGRHARYSVGLRLASLICLAAAGCSGVPKQVDSYTKQTLGTQTHDGSIAKVIKKEVGYAVSFRAKEGKAYDNIFDLRTSPDRSRVAYVGLSKAGVSVVVDAVEQMYQDVMLDSLKFSPDGRHYAFAARRLLPGRQGTREKGVRQGRMHWFIVTDGEPSALAWDAIGDRSPVFSPDGKHLVYTGFLGDLLSLNKPFAPYGTWFFVVDEQVVRSHGGGFSEEAYLDTLANSASMLTNDTASSTLLSTYLVSIVEVDGKPNSDLVLRLEPGEHSVRFSIQAQEGDVRFVQDTCKFEARAGGTYCSLYSSEREYNILPQVRLFPPPMLHGSGSTINADVRVEDMGLQKARSGSSRVGVMSKGEVPEQVRSEDEVALLNALRLHKSPGFYVAPEIPPNKLANARESCNVAADHQVLALVDATIWGNAKNCLLVTTGGVYIRNSWSGDSAGRHYLPWSAFMDGGLGRSGPSKYEVVVAGVSFDISGCSMSENDLIDMLLEVQAVLRRARQGSVTE